MLQFHYQASLARETALRQGFVVSAILARVARRTPFRTITEAVCPAMFVQNSMGDLPLNENTIYRVANGQLQSIVRLAIFFQPKKS